MEIKPEKVAKAMDVQRSAEMAVGEQTASSTKTDAQSLKGGVKKEQSKSFDATFVAPETQRADRNKYGYPESYRELMDNTDFEHQHRTSYQGQCIERSPYRYVSVQDIHHYVHVYLAFDYLWYEGKIVAVDTSTNSCDIKLVHNGDVITMYPHESIIIKLSKKVESEPVTQSARVDVDMHIDDDAVYRKCINKMKHNELMGYHRNEDDQYHHYAKTKESKPAKVPFCRSMMAHELPSRLSDISNIQHWREMGKIPTNVINSYVSMNMTIYEDDDYFSDGKDFNEYSGHADHSLSDVTLKAKHLTDTNDTVQYLADMIIKAPIRQNLYQSPDAKGGVYHCVNVVEHERMSVRYFYEKTESELQREIKESKKTKEIMQWIENNEIEQHMDEIQREWIRNLTYRHPLYGADSIGSLFHPQQIWNLANMDTVLNLISNDIQGVTIPYLYFGSWRSMFAWHIEDRALWAVNYLHFGKPKIWFGVPPSDCDKMEQVLAANYPKDAAFCHVFTRHKSSFVAPKLLEKAGVRVYRAVQRANEIIISSPKAYHSGFNLGFNCAEAVNLAMPSWIPVGIAAPHCQCGLMQSSVKFDIIALIDEIKHKYPALAADIPPLPKNYRKILQSQNTPKRQLDCYYVPPAVKKRKLSNNTVVSTVTSSNVASPCTSTKTPAPSTPIAGTSEKATRGGRGRGRGRPPMNRMSRMMNKTYRFGSRNGRKNRKSDLNVPGLPSLIPPRTLMNLNMMNTNKNALVKPGK